MHPDGDEPPSIKTPALNEESPSESSTITRDPIAGRSLTAAFTWYLFRLLAPRFIPPLIHQKGPQTLSFPPPIPASCVAEHWEYDAWTMVSIRRREEGTGLRRAMIYYHGGAFHHPVNKGHWTVASHFAEELDAEVTMVPLPLAPENTADDVIPVLLRVYAEFVKRSKGREIILAGDSSGGNLALIVALASAAHNIPPPQQLILLSPWLDPSCTNPTMFTVAPLDPILRIPRIRAKGHSWAQGTQSLAPDKLVRKLADPLLMAPLGASLAPLVAAQTQVIITSGTYDILHPDIELFLEKAERAGVRVYYIEGKGQVHVFPMYARIIPEGRVALDKITSAVKGYYGGERWASHSSVDGAEG